MDWSDGERVELTVELVSRAPVDDQPVWRLLVDDDDGRHALVVAPGYDGYPLPGDTGARYAVGDAVIIRRAPDSAPAVSGSCPECGGGLRAGTALDVLAPAVRTARAALDVTEPFFVADDATTITPIGRMTGDGSAGSRDPIDAPAAVCTRCGNHLESHAQC